MLRYALIAAAGAILVTGCQRQQDDLAGAREDVQQAGEDLRGEAQDLQQAEREQAANQGEAQTIQGRVQTVDQDTVAVQTERGEELELKFDENTMDFSGQPIRITEIQEGSEIRASYSEEGGENVIRSIEVTGQGQQEQMQPQGGEELNPGQIDPSQQQQEQMQQ